MEIMSSAIKKMFGPARLLWDSSNGTAIRTENAKGNVSYRAKPAVKPKSGTRKPTEAEDNARGRAIRRRQNRAARGWLPYAQR